jgi:hypothetical protein
MATSMPTTDPTGLPSASPSSPAPSDAPSFSTLCNIAYEQDTQLVFQRFEDENTTGWENVKLDTSGSDFTNFLGTFQSGDAFPEYTINFDTTKVNRMFISFIFYEIDSWDGNGADGTDSLSMKIEGDQVDSIQFGWFMGNFSEPSSSGNSTNDLVAWSIESDPISASPQGFADAADQRHNVLLSFPPEMYAVGGSLKLTLAWNLVGLKDEGIGLDNIKVTACVDVAPSSTPSLSPSMSLAPSAAPSNSTAPAV